MYSRKQFVRTALLLGEEGIERLGKKRVAVFGLGGVGGYAAEALARSGIGAMDLIDHDRICESNLNRQIIASYDTIGRMKVQVMKERIASFHPGCGVTIFECFYLPEERERFPFSDYDYIVDAIDTITAKIDLAVTAKNLGIPIISCMGAGNKLDPCKLELADIYDTSVCPLAKVMRKELRARGITGLKVVYSKEPSIKPIDIEDNGTNVAHESNKTHETYDTPGKKPRSKQIPGSTAFVPAVAGLIMAGEVVRNLTAGE